MSDRTPQQYDLEGGGVRLDFGREWCERHLEPLRARWPEGAGVAMLLLFDAFVRDERTIAAAPLTSDGMRDSRALGRLVAEHGPLCCYLGDETARDITAQALAGTGWRIDRARRAS